MDRILREDPGENRGDSIRGGVIAGTIAGAVLALVMVIPAAGNLHATWPSLRVASYPFIGPQVFHSGLEPWSLVLGTVIHFVLSVGWGLLFMALNRKRSRATTLLLGVPFGAAVWLFMYHGVLPLIGAVALVHRVPWIISLSQHLAFGLALGLTVALMQPQMWRRRSREQLPA